MNNGIQVFENSDFGKVRVVERNGEPWFVAADVCTYFGVTNRNRIMQAVDAEDKGGTQMDTPRWYSNSCCSERVWSLFDVIRLKTY